MSVTTVTRFHALERQVATLFELQSKGDGECWLLRAASHSTSSMIRPIKDPLPFFKPGRRAKHAMPHLES
jgi:hypothetical protein